MAEDRLAETVLPGLASRSDGREDASARRVQLLIARSGCAQGELAGPIACKTRVRVAVDEAGNRAEATPVELGDVAGERTEVAHPPGRRNHTVLAEQEGVFPHVDLAERLLAQGRVLAGRRHQLGQVADEQACGQSPGLSRGHQTPSEGAMGGSRPPRSAASRASS